MTCYTHLIKIRSVTIYSVQVVCIVTYIHVFVVLLIFMFPSSPSLFSFFQTFKIMPHIMCSLIKKQEIHLKVWKCYSCCLQYVNTTKSLSFIFSHLSFTFKNYINQEQKALMPFHQSLDINMICESLLVHLLHQILVLCLKRYSLASLECGLTALIFHYFPQSRDEMDERILIIVSW